MFSHESSTKLFMIDCNSVCTTKIIIIIICLCCPRFQRARLAPRAADGAAEHGHAVLQHRRQAESGALHHI